MPAPKLSGSSLSLMVLCGRLEKRTPDIPVTPLVAHLSKAIDNWSSVLGGVLDP